MIFLVSVFMTISGLFFTYITVGLVRAHEKRRGYLECEKRLQQQRNQFRRTRSA